MGGNAQRERPRSPRPARATVTGVLALVVWAVYIALTALQLPDAFPSALVAAGFGLLACVAIAIDFRHWRLAVLLASAVFLGIYVHRVVGMLVIGADAGH